MLQIGIHRHDGFAARGFQPGSERQLMAEVPREFESNVNRMMIALAGNEFPAPILAAVIHQHHLERTDRTQSAPPHSVQLAE